MIKLYTLLDKASSTTNHPMAFQTERDALDGLKNVASDPSTALNKHPEDFELFQLGEYNPRSMKFEIYDDPKSIISVSDLIQ